MGRTMARGSTGGHRSVAGPDSRTVADDRPGYVDTSEVSLWAGESRSAEHWSRALFEEAPRPIPWFLSAGWRIVLGLRLGPRRSPGHVLGWRITSNESDEIRLESRSPLMTAQLVLRTSPTTTVLTTNVYFRSRLAHPIWAVVAPIHRQVVPYLLRRAASSSAER